MTHEQNTDTFLDALLFCDEAALKTRETVSPVQSAFLATAGKPLPKTQPALAAPSLPPPGLSERTGFENQARLPFPGYQGQTQEHFDAFKHEMKSLVSVRQPVYRDPRDVRLIFWLALALLVTGALAFLLGLAFAFHSNRTPDRIVVDRTTGQVLIDNRNFGQTDGVEMMKDRLTDQDKLYLSRQFLKLIYQIDPLSRKKDLEKAMSLMVPATAREYATDMKGRGVWTIQRQESWQSTWVEQEMTIDPSDPYLIRVLGSQKIWRTVNAQVVEEVKQYTITLKLTAAKEGRTEGNLRTGFYVAVFGDKDVVATQ